MSNSTGSLEMMQGSKLERRRESKSISRKISIVAIIDSGIVFVKDLI